MCDWLIELLCARVCVCVRVRVQPEAFCAPAKNQRHCIMNGEADQLQCRRRSLGPNTRRLSLHSFNWALSNVTWLTQREGEAGGNQMRSVCHSFTRKLTSAKLLFALEPVSRSVLKRRPEFCLLVEKGGKKKKDVRVPVGLHLPVKSAQPVYTGC